MGVTSSGSRHVVAALAALLVCVSTDLGACGDKFLVPSRGVRFQPRPADRAAAQVLVYARPGSALSDTLVRLSVGARLRAAGYRPTFVTSEAGLGDLLGRAPWDVVVVDLDDGPALAPRLPAGAPPTVLPVAQRAPSATTDAARHQYPRVLDSPSRGQAFLDAVDRAVVERTKARRRVVTSASE